VVRGLVARVGPAASRASRKAVQEANRRRGSLARALATAGRSHSDRRDRFGSAPVWSIANWAAPAPWNTGVPGISSWEVTARLDGSLNRVNPPENVSGEAYRGVTATPR